jgi:membrane-associated protease RseP (regulator of RpoE activity)
VNEAGGTADTVTDTPSTDGDISYGRRPADVRSSSTGAEAGRLHDPEPDYREPKGSVVQLIAVVAAILAVSMLTHSLDLLIVIVAIIVMVMIHELGHFATAKWSHMKVTEYFLGFGPRLWSFRRGETEYGVKVLPLGGYVKIIGMSNTEVVDPADEARTYRQQPFHNRLMVALAGSFMHFVMAFVLIWGLIVIVGEPQLTTSVAGLESVSHGVDPAATAGLHVGDDIVSINGRPISSADELKQIVGRNAGRPLTLGVERGNPARMMTVTVTPAVPAGANAKTSAQIGIQIGVASDRVNPIHALGTAAVGVWQVTDGTVSALGHTFSPHGLDSFFSQLGNSKAADTAARDRTRPESIVGAVRTATQGAQGGVFDLIEVLVNIIIAVGIINLVPMLPLDGGHVLVAVYERIRSRRGRKYHADVNKLTPVASAFVLFLIVFVAAAVFLDITHPIANPFQ